MLWALSKLFWAKVDIKHQICGWQRVWSADVDPALALTTWRPFPAGAVSVGETTPE